jgi:hypothetical protein
MLFTSSLLPLTLDGVLVSTRVGTALHVALMRLANLCVSSDGEQAADMA